MTKPEDEPKNRDEPKNNDELDRWSAADFRLLWITFGATLAANIATVFVVAIAIALSRHGQNIAFWPGGAAIIVLAWVAAALGVAALSSRWWRHIHIPSGLLAKSIMVSLVLSAIVLLLILLAKAANIK